MKPIILFNSDLAGGAGSFIVILADVLVTLGIETHIIVCHSRTDYSIPEGVKFHQLDTIPSKSLEEALKLTLENIGTVRGIFSNSTPANKILSKIHHPRSCHIIHSAEEKHYTGWSAPLRRILRHRKYRRLYSGKNLLTVSRGLKHYIVHELKATPRSIHTLYNPFEFETIYSLADRPVEGIPSEPFLLHVGRLDIAHKRHDVLLKAYKKANPNEKLVLLGKGKDEEKIRTLIRELDLRHRVLMPGFSPNPYAWIKRAKLLILSSDFEGFPRVLIEAFLLKTPVVSTDCPTGPSEILTGELEHFLVPVGDVEALARTIGQARKGYPSLHGIDLSRFESHQVAQAFLRLPLLSDKRANQ